MATLGVLGVGLSTAGAQSVIKLATPERLMPLLKAAGYTVTLDRSGKTPFLKVENAQDGRDFYLDFLNCNSTSCDGAFANVFYDPKTFKKTPDLKSINAWNQDYVTQAYLDDDGKPHLISTYSFIGGFTNDNLMAWISSFYDELGSFDKMFNGTGGN